MGKEKRRPVRGGAVETTRKSDARLVSSITRPLPSNLPITHPLSATGAAADVDLPALRLRLVGVRRHLLERLDEDWPDDRCFPDSAWTKMLADIHITIAAVDDMIAAAGP